MAILLASNKYDNWELTDLPTHVRVATCRYSVGKTSDSKGCPAEKWQTLAAPHCTTPFSWPSSDVGLPAQVDSGLILAKVASHGKKDIQHRQRVI